MKFSIDKNILSKALDNANKAIDPNNIYFNLREFSINVLEDMIIIKGSNGYFSIETKIEKKEINSISSIGDFLVSASLFNNLIKKCSGIIDFYIEKDILYINNGLDKYEINLMSENEYPNIDFSLYGNKIQINAARLREAINNVIFATSQTNDEMILSGVNIKFENSKLILTGTDGYRLARDIIDVPDDRNISFDVTITNKHLKNFIPLNIEGDVILFANEHKINLIYENTNFQSKIIEAPYKNVENLFVDDYSKELIIDRLTFLNAINKTTVISGSDSTLNRIYIQINEEQISLSTSADEIGRTKIIIDKSNYEWKSNEELKIVFNYKYLKEAIGIFNDKIKMKLTNSMSKVLIESDDSAIKQIVSPMNS